MKSWKIALFCCLGILAVVAFSNISWASFNAEDGIYSSESVESSMPVAGPKPFVPPSTSPATPVDPAPIPDDGPPAAPPVGPPPTQWTIGPTVIYQGNGMNLTPTSITAPANSQVTASGGPSLTIITGTGSPIGVGIDNVTPISSFWAPGVASPTNLPSGSYVVSPIWAGSGLTTDNPMNKPKK